jgi:hypothetical protein
MDESAQSKVETMTSIQSDHTVEIEPETQTASMDQANPDDSQVTGQASQEAATETKLGYLTSIDWITYICSFDEIQWLTDTDNQEELWALDIDPESLANGFYIHNAEEKKLSLGIDYNCKFTILRGAEPFDVPLADFRHSWEDHLNFGYQTPYRVELQDKIIVSISQVYVP